MNINRLNATSETLDRMCIGINVHVINGASHCAGLQRGCNATLEVQNAYQSCASHVAQEGSVRALQHPAPAARRLPGLRKLLLPGCALMAALPDLVSEALLKMLLCLHSPVPLQPFCIARLRLSSSPLQSVRPHRHSEAADAENATTSASRGTCEIPLMASLLTEPQQRETQHLKWARI